MDRAVIEMSSLGQVLDNVSGLFRLTTLPAVLPPGPVFLIFPVIHFCNVQIDFYPIQTLLVYGVHQSLLNPLENVHRMKILPTATR